jgi:hypothetical protein
MLSSSLALFMLPDPMEITGLSFWMLALILGTLSFLVTYFWPVRHEELLIFESEEELQRMCWEGLRNLNR